MAEERIQKVLSNLGIMSRREADRMIKAGKVIVNGTKVTPGAKVDLTRDTLIVDRKEIKFAPVSKHFILNKPQGYICSHKDPEGRRVIFDLIDDKGFMTYIGRLDYNSEGLVIITNDGELKHFMESPENGIEREYRIKVHRQVNRDDVKKFLTPFKDESGRTIRPERVYVLKSNDNSSWLRMILKEGANREIRKICEKHGHPVSRLIRERYGPIKLKNVKKGHYRELSFKELSALKKMMGKK